MNVSRRSGPTRFLTLYAAPLAMLAVVLTILVQPRRFPVEDRLCLLAVLGAASALYLKDRRLVATALAFGVASWHLDAGPPVWASGWLRSLVALRVPPPPDPSPNDFEEAFARSSSVVVRFEEECSLYGFILANALAFLLLLGARALLMRRKRPEAA